MTRQLFSLLAIAFVLLVGCGSGTEPGARTASESVNESVPAELQFSAKTLGGEDFSGASLLGKPTVLWFWAPWCPVCQREAPLVGATARANPGVTFIGVAAQDQASAMQRFVDTYPVEGFTHLADTDGAVWAKFGVTHQPAYAFIDSEGDIDVVKASLPEAELSERVNALVNR